MMRKTIFPLIAVATLALAYIGTHRTPLVVSAAVQPTAAVERLIVGAGRIEPVSEEIKIGSDLDGRLRDVPVEEGQAVRRGQVVATIENADYQARMDLASATLTEREAELERLLNGSRVEERRESDAAVREAEAVLEHARIERDRRVQLRDYGVISRSEFDAAAREYSVATEHLAALRERAALVRDQSRPEDIKRGYAEVERSRAQLAEAQALLAKTVIHSPLDGVVLRKKLKAGESVSGGLDTILTIGDCSRLRVRVDVDENDVARLRAGQIAWVRAEAYGDRKFRGRVTRIGQILGRKNVRTDEPTERVDLKILETLVDLDPGVSIPVGLRVDAYIDPRS